MKHAVVTVLAFCASVLPQVSRAATPCAAPNSLVVQALCELTNRDEAVLSEAMRDADSEERIIWRMDDSGYISLMDWKTESRDALNWFDALLVKRGMPILTKAQRAEMTKAGDAEWGPSVPLEAIGPMMADHLEAQGARLLYVDTSSDSYGYAIVSPAFMARWEGVALSEYIRLSRLSADVQRMGFGDDKRWRSVPVGSPVYENK